MNNQQLITYAQRMLQNPEVRQNLPNAPWVEPAINALMSNDAKAGQEIANNLMQSSGLTKDQLNAQIQNELRNLGIPI